MAKTRTILITGCSAEGIGAALAIALAKQGHHIFATARNTSKIPSELSSLPNVSVLPLDVSSKESVAEAARAVEEAGKGLDVLVNNAGLGYTMPILDLDIEKAQNLYNANVWGLVRTVQAFAGQLIKSKGRVVNVSSVGSVVNTPWIGTYASSKAAVNSISETLRLELSPFGVSVVTVMLGTVATSFHANEPTPELPATSYYTAILDTITKWAKGEAGPKGGSAQDLVDSIIPDIVADGRSGVVWRGANSGAVKFVSRWVPGRMLDGMMSTGQGLDELAKSLTAKN
ncbi:nadph-dependent 1-acyldihydroxyacetone phosphate reductase [Trichoderma arundinaceum]|uniref:Nadph-dependent 1-acyldihydroxyacetone phosphate reductase n=1 Tax=Trichoderma arundinaceum TaxID=490622 RepID=A0A395P0J0_TRIAR|nr:nadph-dependent 1-acyldihydroxyacetone phosphate reductase [Trichoderma arundinaceum]